jgi:hypothetical protein
MRVGLTLLLIAICVQAQEDPKDLLLRATDRVMQSVRGQPRYLCTQTIDRASYRPADQLARSCDRLAADKKAGHWKTRLFSTDRLRLDVAAGTSQMPAGGVSDEMYSWPGAIHFHDQGLFDLVRKGLVANGSFRGLLTTIFGGGTAAFTYDGDMAINGRAVAEFGFRIPLETSNFRFLYGPALSESQPYSVDGTFLIDTTTADLVRLTIHGAPSSAGHMAPLLAAGACETTQVLDYGLVHLRQREFLLPTQAELELLMSDGTEQENRTAFTGCHEFRGEATLLTGPAPDTDSPAVDGESSAPSPAIPSGMSFDVAFTQKIDTATAAAGDPLTAVLETPLRDHAVLIPKGAAIEARILRIEHLYGGGLGRNSIILEVRLETVDVGGKSWPLLASETSGIRRFQTAEGALLPRIDLGPINSAQSRRVGLFRFSEGPKYVIKPGLKSSWRTIAPES